MTATAPVPAPEDVAGRQRAAIEASGWGERFRLVQPRNPMFWLYLWAMGAGVVHAAHYYGPQLGTYGGALAAGTIAFALYTIPWVLFLHAHDRYAPEAPKLILAGFAWGAVVATTFLALTVNTAVLSLYAKLFGQAWAADWAPALTAPFTEETAKALGLLVLLGLAPRLVRSAFDAFVLGAFIGLGFQVSEDVLYAFNGAQTHFGSEQAAGVAQTIGVRAASGLVSHALFSAVVCTGVAWVGGFTADGRHVRRGVLAIVAAMVLHGTWDGTGAIAATLLGDPAFAPVVILVAVVAGIVLVVAVARRASEAERGWMHDLLAPEVGAGVVTEDEVAAVASPRRKARRIVKHSVHGHHERRIAHHVVEATHDLAEAIARSGGVDTPEVAHARAEIARVRTL